ncbi:MAG: hypothetical protein DCC55_28760, partial [Chloroflexi bacterium]
MVQFAQRFLRLLLAMILLVAGCAPGGLAPPPSPTPLQPEVAPVIVQIVTPTSPPDEPAPESEAAEEESEPEAPPADASEEDAAAAEESATAEEPAAEESSAGQENAAGENATAAEEPAPEEEVDAAQLMSLGEEVYTAECATCHQEDGQGTSDFPALAGNEFVLAEDPTPVLDVVLHGRGEMPAFADSLSDEEIAGVVTYIRNTWDNEAAVVSPTQVQQVREGEEAAPAEE